MDPRRVEKLLDKLEDNLAVTPLDLPACSRAAAELRSELTPAAPRCLRPGEEWCRALRRQAEQELHAAELLASQPGGPPFAVLAMLLQMVFEKLAKAALARADVASFAAHLRKHSAASAMVEQLRVYSRHANLRHQWKEVLPLVLALERAHPALAQHGFHLEYPWEDDDGVHSPEDLPVVRELADPRKPRAPQLLRFARELALRFDEIFA